MKTKREAIKTAIFLVFTVFLAFSCNKKKEIPEINCTNLINGILNSDAPAIKKEMSIITKDLMPHPTTDDEWGHKENFNLLIDRLNRCDEINAVLFCYGCIYTLPPQSEITITINSNGQQIQRIFDILTSKDTSLVYLGMHNSNK